eukprot:3672193-Amphidinium_carterae.2
MVSLASEQGTEAHTTPNEERKRRSWGIVFEHAKCCPLPKIVHTMPCPPPPDPDSIAIDSCTLSML